MSTNVSLKSHLNNLLAFQYKPGTKQILESSINLQTLENELKDVTITVTLWGTRSVSKPGYSGSVNLRWLAYKVADISKKYPWAVVPARYPDEVNHLSAVVHPSIHTPERDAGRAVQKQIVQLFEESDEMLKKTFFARIFSAIRELFVYNFTGPNMFFNIGGDPLSYLRDGLNRNTPTFLRGLEPKEDGQFEYYRSPN